jgi:hypothetical protein
MDPIEWEPEDYGEDYPTEWEPEAYSPSSALARRFFPARRRPTPARPTPRTTVLPPGTPPGMAAVLDRIRTLDERQRATASQLATFQQRTAAQQASETFGPLATGAAGAFALGIRGGDAFSPFITHGLPVAQLLLASRGRAISSGFRANPWSTLGFPIAAVLLTVFRDRIPGLGTPTVDPPDVTVLPDGAGGFFVTSRRPAGVVLRFTVAARGLPDPSDPDSSSAVFPSVISLASGDRLKIRAFRDSVASDTVLVAAP